MAIVEIRESETRQKKSNHWNFRTWCRILSLRRAVTSRRFSRAWWWHQLSLTPSLFTRPWKVWALTSQLSLASSAPRHRQSWRRLRRFTKKVNWQGMHLNFKSDFDVIVFIWGQTLKGEALKIIWLPIHKAHYNYVDWRSVQRGLYSCYCCTCR